MTFATQIDKSKVEALLHAIEAGQSEEAAKLVDDLTQIREGELYQQVQLLTQNLHQTLDDLEEDAPILLHTKHDLPDITERLKYVMNETDNASNKTLSSAENALGLVEQLASSLEGGALQGFDKQLVEQINHELTNIMLAQSFQDLTGQVLNRVILIVTTLEESLKELISRSRHNFEAIPERAETLESKKEQEEKGMGPNVTQKSKQDTVESQDDVDDLLSDLGI
ncbi:protein phosphatase CheZ [Thiomicrorhabdus sp.]|uniref:protein phosphatase CheZ n=1 Tax=Thiomicrorhabdus sp. TaxID=2039724 RepID=UPI0035649895